MPNPTNRKIRPHTRLPRLNFVLVSTLATLRNGMVLVDAPNGIRPNRVFGALYWIRVLDAAIEVLSQKMMTLGLNLSPTMFFSPGANVNSVMVCAFSDMCCLPSVRVAVNALRWEGTESSLVPLVGRPRPMSCPRRPAPIWRRYRVMLPLVASSGTGRDRMLVSRPVVGNGYGGARSGFRHLGGMHRPHGRRAMGGRSDFIRRSSADGTWSGVRGCWAGARLWPCIRVRPCPFRIRSRRWPRRPSRG